MPTAQADQWLTTPHLWKAPPQLRKTPPLKAVPHPRPTPPIHPALPAGQPPPTVLWGPLLVQSPPIPPLRGPPTPHPACGPYGPHGPTSWKTNSPPISLLFLPLPPRPFLPAPHLPSSRLTPPHKVSHPSATVSPTRHWAPGRGLVSSCIFGVPQKEQNWRCQVPTGGGCRAGPRARPPGGLVPGLKGRGAGGGALPPPRPPALREDSRAPPSPLCSQGSAPRGRGEASIC